MSLMKSVAKYLLSVVLLAVFGTAAGVVAVCYGDEFYWVALRAARWFGPAGLGVTMLVAAFAALRLAASNRPFWEARRAPGRCDMGHDCEAGFTDVDGRFWCSTYHRDQQVAIDAEMRQMSMLGVRKKFADEYGSDAEGDFLQAGGAMPQEAVDAPITVREPGAVISGTHLSAVPEDLRIPFDPVFDDGPTVINNPAPRPRRETQRLVTLAHQRALGKEPE